ncbi:MAG: hypothetical protein WBD20_18460 [Pirellulaceae bacterium]
MVDSLDVSRSSPNADWGYQIEMRFVKSEFDGILCPDDSGVLAKDHSGYASKRERDSARFFWQRSTYQDEI